MPKSDKQRIRKRSSSNSDAHSPSPIKRRKKEKKNKEEKHDKRERTRKLRYNSSDSELDSREKRNHDTERDQPQRRSKHKTQSSESDHASSPEIPRHKKRHRSNSGERRHKRDEDRNNERVRIKQEPTSYRRSPGRRDSGYRHDRIKREEDFDQRQEVLRQRRRHEHHPEDHRRSNHERYRPDQRVKEEPQDNGRGRGERAPRGDERSMNDQRRLEARKRRDEAGETKEAFENEEKSPDKEKPNLGLSGALTEDKNTFRGVVINYREPPEARVPKKKWRFYPFKGTESLKVLHLHRQSAYLIGRLRRIADIPVDHPSCSKQHAVFQFRMIEEEVDGVLRRRVKPYIIDLGASNGTFLNNERIEAQRYVELREQDVLKFGFSSREYVLLHAKSDTTDVGSESEAEDE